MQDSSFRFPTLPAGGLQTNRPANLVSDGKYPFLRNLTRVIDGQLNPRFGYGAPISNPGGGSIHSICRINNIGPDTTPAYYLVGAGANLYVGTSVGALTLIDTGYSGAPLSIIPYRPDQSPDTWAYVFDVARFKKYKVSDILSPVTNNIGIVPPSLTPIVELDPWIVNGDDVLSATGWSASGIASGVMYGTRVPGSTTIAAIVYDSGTTGFATVGITSSEYTWLGLGSRVIINTGGGNQEMPTMADVSTILSSTTIAAIAYDVGTTGFCSIQMATPFQALNRNMLLSIGGEAVRVQQVAVGRDGLPSFRCSTVSTHAVAEAITSYASARMFFVNTHTAGESITGGALQFTSTLAAATTSGIGAVNKVETIDFSQAPALGVAFGPNDYLHLSIWLDNPQNVLEGRLYFNINVATNTSFYLSFNPSQFVSSTTGSLTTNAARQGVLVQQVVNQAELDQYNNSQYGSQPTSDTAASTGTFIQQLGAPLSANTNTGVGVWTELFLPYSALASIGENSTASMAGVTGITVWLNVSGTVICKFASIWGGGGYGPNASPATNGIGFQFPAYLYRSRYRNSKTGSISAPSPANYSGVLPVRQQVRIITESSTDPQVDYVDVERLGGSAFDTFHYIGSRSNAGGFVLDGLTDDAVRFSETFPEDSYKPFAVDDLPRNGVVNVAGTTVTWVSGDLFNLDWVGGTQILINQVAYTLAGSPKFTTQLWIVESAGAQTAVPYSIPNPTLQQQTLPAVWGPLRQRLFACGSPISPGLVFFTFVDNPDAHSDTAWVEVTSPSEPLMNGCIYEESSIVFSTERAFRLQPSYGDNPNIFTPIPLASGRGLYARYGLCVGPKIWFVGRDGIYEYAADGGSVSITDGDLYNLFPHDSQPGQSVTVDGDVIVAPDYKHPNDLRLSYCNNWVYFDYRGQDGNFYTLAYHTLRHEWYYYIYTDGATLHYTAPGIGVNETLIGFVDGTVAAMQGSSDNGTAITSVAATPDWYNVSRPGILALLTLFTTHGLNGWQHIREMYLQYKSAVPVGLTIITGDGKTFGITLPASTGVSKQYFVCPANCKGKTFRYIFEGGPDLLLYESECEVHVRAWGSNESYQPIKAFTNLYRIQG